MANYRCVKKCFHRNRLWTVGETLSSLPGEVVPRHFRIAEAVKPEKVEVVQEDPKTFLEMQRADARAALASIGHGDRTQEIARVKEKIAEGEPVTKDEVKELEADPAKSVADIADDIFA